MSENLFVDFIGEKSWFNRKYMPNLSYRFPTFKIALNLFLQFGGRTIVETGCVRLPDDFGSGQSTVIFCEFVNHYGGHVWSIDINPNHLAVCEQLTGQYAGTRTLICADSVTYLASPEAGFPERIDLLYLDSYDYPIGELLLSYSSSGDQQKAFADLQATPEEEIVRRYSDLLLPCQQHCQGELIAARSRFHERTIVLIDDSFLPGGGKPRLAKETLRQWGWTCLFDSQQTLWFQA